MTRTIEECLYYIADWLYNQANQEGWVLEFGIWDEDDSPHTYYALVRNKEDDNTYIGESSYGSDTIDEALNALVEDL